MNFRFQKAISSLKTLFIFNIPAIKSFLHVYIIMEKELQKKSLEKFFRLEYRKLVNYVRKNLEDRFFEASPEDIVQDVMLGLMGKLEVDAQIGNMTAYLYRSVKNRIIDSQKKKQRNVSIENFTELKNGNSILNSVTDETSSEEKDYLDIGPEELQYAISQLRPDEQAVIIATEFEDQSYEELSEEWDVPVGTLLSRKHRALSKLQRMLLTNQKQ
jgi:RNA polymerase sigma factor (sigma-70 family)